MSKYGGAFKRDFKSIKTAQPRPLLWAIFHEFNSQKVLIQDHNLLLFSSIKKNDKAEDTSATLASLKNL